MKSKNEISHKFQLQNGERFYQRFLEEDLTILGEALSIEKTNCVVFQQYRIDQNNVVDFLLVHGRSNAIVDIIEIKGNNFRISTNNSIAAQITQAVMQCAERFSVIRNDKRRFQDQLASNINALRNGKFSGLIMGDIHFEVPFTKEWRLSGIALGGYETNKDIDNRNIYKLEENMKEIKIKSYDSLLRKIDRA